MDRPLLAYTLWLSYSDKHRAMLRKLFNIPRTGESVVHVGEIMSGNIGARQEQDQHKPADLYAITIERIYELLGQPLPESQEDQNFYGAFSVVVENLEDIYYENFPEDIPPPPVVEATQSAAPQPAPVAEFVPRDPIELLKKTETVLVEQMSDGTVQEVTTTTEVITSEPGILTEAAVLDTLEKAKEWDAKEITKPKTEGHAKTTKAKSTKTAKTK